MLQEHIQASTTTISDVEDVQLPEVN